MSQRQTNATVIDAVGEVVSTTPAATLPAVDTRQGTVARAYARARGALWRRAPAPPVAEDTITLPAASGGGASIARLSFYALVLLPGFVAAIYYTFVAADQYVAELRFVVRMGQQDTAQNGPLGALARSAATASNTSTEDAFIVTSYIRSRAIVDDLSRRVNLREIFTRPEADVVARLRADASVDELREYWQKMVGTSVEGMSGIVTVEVRAFRADDAVLLATHVEQLAERLVNDISTRARRDAVRRATEEVERAQGQMYASLAEMERYRNAEGLIDPIQTATETGKILTQVLTDQLAVENQLFVATQSLGPDSPSVRNLTQRVEGLRRQSRALREQLAGNKAEARNVAAALGRFEEVSVKQKMAESLYTLAVNGLDRARRTSEAQSVYLTTFVHPRLPEEYTHPRRVFYPIAVTLSCLVFWAIGALIWASVEDHRLN